MEYDPTIHKRRSIRLKGYDYSSAGAYFITICTHRHVYLFGNIVDEEMQLNKVGRIVANEWKKTEVIRKEVKLDEWVIMPNHLHGIVFINRTEDWYCSRGDRPVALTAGLQPRSIGAMVAGFKSAATKRVNKLRKTPGAKLWQRNYWEHIIRSEPELNGLREYIRNNPAKWEMDRLYKGS
jgi:REP element-mobilizing transposase RayT